MSKNLSLQNSPALKIGNAQNMVMDSFRDGLNVPNGWASQVQVFKADEVYKIGDEWNVQNLLWNSLNSRMIYWLVLSVYCKVWIWILKNLRCLSCKSINFVLRVKMFWLFRLCFYVWFCCFDCSGYVCCLVCMIVLMVSVIKLGYIHCRCGRNENILIFVLPPLCFIYMNFLMVSAIKLGC